MFRLRRSERFPPRDFSTELTGIHNAETFCAIFAIQPVIPKQLLP